ncbi:MAG TPA: hypothetical protein VGM41_18385 [Chitinophagaceae bacterium]|jgi:hypothetical protein
MLQNRVDPSGNLITTKARGLWMGNRGVIHDHNREIIRPFKLDAWITCRLEFKGKRRPIMAPDRWTELFFLDEATSFAAGHRPCFECRREDAVRFKLAWLKGNPGYNFNEKTSIREIDKILHKERINRDRSKVTFEEDARAVPNGSFVLLDENPYLVLENVAFLWTPFGYGKAISLLAAGKLTVLTPRSTVNAFRAGYRPQMS